MTHWVLPCPGLAYSRLKLGIFSCLDLVALPVLSMARETGDGGGAGGRVSWNFGFEAEPMNAREMSCEKASLAVVGGERVRVFGVEMVAILLVEWVVLRREING